MFERLRQPEFSKERTKEEAAIQIEREVIKRASIPPEKWIAQYGQKYRELWNANTEEFLSMEKEKPEELYGLIAQVLESADSEKKG